MAPPDRPPHAALSLPKRPPHPATVAQRRVESRGDAPRPPHPATVVQRRIVPHPATVARGHDGGDAHPLGPVAQRSQTSWDKLRRKQKFDSWHEVDQVWGRYQIDNADWEWILIAKALRCALPPRVGHASGKIGDDQEHVNNAVRFYVESVAQPAAADAHPGKKRKALYADLVSL